MASSGTTQLLAAKLQSTTVTDACYLLRVVRLPLAQPPERCQMPDVNSRRVFAAIHNPSQNMSAPLLVSCCQPMTSDERLLLIVCVPKSLVLFQRPERGEQLLCAYHRTSSQVSFSGRPAVVEVQSRYLVTSYLAPHDLSPLMAGTIALPGAHSWSELTTHTRTHACSPPSLYLISPSLLLSNAQSGSPRIPEIKQFLMNMMNSHLTPSSLPTAATTTRSS